MPSVDLSQAYWYLVVALPLLIGPSPSHGFSIDAGGDWPHPSASLSRSWSPHVASGIGLVDYLILKPDPLISEFSWSGVVAPALFLLVATDSWRRLSFVRDTARG